MEGKNSWDQKKWNIPKCSTRNIQIIEFYETSTNALHKQIKLFLFSSMWLRTQVLILLGLDLPDLGK